MLLFIAICITVVQFIIKVVAGMLLSRITDRDSDMMAVSTSILVLVAVPCNLITCIARMYEVQNK